MKARVLWWARLAAELTCLAMPAAVFMAWVNYQAWSLWW